MGTPFYKKWKSRAADFPQSTVFVKVVPKPDRFVVSLTALAYVKGSVDVTAKTADEAKKQAQASAGDVSWEYDGLQGDDSVTVDSVRPAQ